MVRLWLLFRLRLLLPFRLQLRIGRRFLAWNVLLLFFLFLGLGRGRRPYAIVIVLQALQLALRSGIGAFHAALGLPQTVEQRDLALGVGDFLEDMRLADFRAAEFPVRDRHLLDVEPFGGS